MTCKPLWPRPSKRFTTSQDDAEKKHESSGPKWARLSKSRRLHNFKWARKSWEVLKLQSRGKFEVVGSCKVLRGDPLCSLSGAIPSKPNTKGLHQYCHYTCTFQELEKTRRKSKGAIDHKPALFSSWSKTSLHSLPIETTHWRRTCKPIMGDLWLLINHRQFNSLTTNRWWFTVKSLGVINSWNFHYSTVICSRLGPSQNTNVTVLALQARLQIMAGVLLDAQTPTTRDTWWYWDIWSKQQ